MVERGPFEHAVRALERRTLRGPFERLASKLGFLGVGSQYAVLAGAR